MMKLKFRLQRKKNMPLTATENTLGKRVESTMILKLGSVMLKVNKDVKTGEETNIEQLFSVDEQTKLFEALEDVTKDETKLKINVAKVCALEAIADATKKKGRKINCFMLLKRNDLSKKIVASRDIKKGEKVEITVEIL